MAIIETKYSLGDKVYKPISTYTSRKIQCPDCVGKKEWLITFPSGEKINISCKTCESGNILTKISSGFVDVFEHNPSVKKLTIGQIRTEGDKISYMCNETGIGSGTLHYENTLFDSWDDAMEEAKKMANEQTKNQMENNTKNKKRFIDDLSTMGYSRSQAIKFKNQIDNYLKLIGE